MPERNTAPTATDQIAAAGALVFARSLNVFAPRPCRQMPFFYPVPFSRITRPGATVEVSRMRSRRDIRNAATGSLIRNRVVVVARACHPPKAPTPSSTGAVPSGGFAFDNGSLCHRVFSCHASVHA